MAGKSVITSDACEQIRSQYSHRDGLEPLAEEHDIDLGTLRYHLYGDCNHETTIEPVMPPVHFQVSVDECEQLRRKYDDGKSPEELKEEYETRWRSIVSHLIGQCSHDSSGPVVSTQEIYDRQSISASACAALRERYIEDKYDSVLDISQDVKWSYETVLRHVNGDCSHALKTPSRTVDKRGSDVSEELFDCPFPRVIRTAFNLATSRNRFA